MDMCRTLSDHMQAMISYMVYRNACNSLKGISSRGSLSCIGNVFPEPPGITVQLQGDSGAIRRGGKSFMNAQPCKPNPMWFFKHNTIKNLTGHKNDLLEEMNCTLPLLWGHTNTHCRPGILPRMRGTNTASECSDSHSGRNSHLDCAHWASSTKFNMRQALISDLASSPAQKVSRAFH